MLLSMLGMTKGEDLHGVKPCGQNATFKNNNWHTSGKRQPGGKYRELAFSRVRDRLIGGKERPCADWGPCLVQEYEAKKASDPEFYRSADSLLYGKDVKDSEDRIERMVAELNDQCAASQRSQRPSALTCRVLSCLHRCYGILPSRHARARTSTPSSHCCESRCRPD